jgi:hypothetical protein
VACRSRSAARWRPATQSNTPRWRTARRAPTRPGRKTFNLPYTPPPTDDEVIVIIQGTVAGDQVFDELDISCGIIQGRGCEMSNHEACLGVGGRTRWELSVLSSLGQGRVVKNTKNEARFSFFDPTLADLLVQILNECSNNDHFWVFYEAQTNVEFDLVVTDTSTGESRQYNNEGQGPFRATLDTSAFATCP